MDKTGRGIALFFVTWVVVMAVIYFVAFINYTINEDAINETRAKGEDLPLPFDVLMSIYEFQLLGLLIMIGGGALIALLLRL